MVKCWYTCLLPESNTKLLDLKKKLDYHERTVYNMNIDLIPCADVSALTCANVIPDMLKLTWKLFSYNLDLWVTLETLHQQLLDVCRQYWYTHTHGYTSDPWRHTSQRTWRGHFTQPPLWKKLKKHLYFFRKLMKAKFPHQAPTNLCRGAVESILTLFLFSYSAVFNI